jgi:hypothetical protein
MAYSLENFCNDTRVALKDDKGNGGREKVRELLGKLLQNKEFVQEDLRSSTGFIRFTRTRILVFASSPMSTRTARPRRRTTMASRGPSTARRSNTPT